MADELPIDSPCIRICTIDEDTGYCEGCYRTRTEIAQWKCADNTYKAALLVQLEERKHSGENKSL